MIRAVSSAKQKTWIQILEFKFSHLFYAILFSYTYDLISKREIKLFDMIFRDLIRWKNTYDHIY